MEEPMRTHTLIDSPIGRLTLVATDGRLESLYLEGCVPAAGPAELGERRDTGFREAEEQLAEYFAGNRTEFSLATAARGTPFQRTVWAAVARIPYGQTRSYKEIAAELESAGPRAVGAANGRNPLCILVPCHRVVGSTGALTGYSGGLDRKRFLLELEASNVPASPALF
jgi:methylated-DNA-[protein]-cysteine S-methyltransferase